MYCHFENIENVKRDMKNVKKIDANNRKYKEFVKTFLK